MVTVLILYPFKVKKYKNKPNPFRYARKKKTKNKKHKNNPQDICLMFVHTHIDTFLTVSEILLNKVLLIKKIN